MTAKNGQALLGTVVGSALGFLFPFALVIRLHAGPQSDAYLFAYGIGLFGATILAGAVEANFLPIAKSAARGRGANLRSVVRRTFLQSAAAAAGVYVGVTLLALVLLGRTAWPPDQRDAALAAVVALSGYAILAVANSVLAAALYALDDFATATLSVALRAAVPLGLLPLVPSSFGSVAVLAVGVSVGELLRTVWLTVALGRRVPRPSSADLQPERLAGSGFWRTVAPHTLNMLVLTSSPVIDRTFAAAQGPGAVTVLDLGEKVLYVPITGLTAVFVLVTSARWAEVALDSPEKLRADFLKSTRGGFLASCVAAIGTVAGVVALTWALAGPDFAGVKDAEFRRIVLYFVLGLPFAIVSTMGARLLTSIRRTRSLPALALLAVTVNAVGDLVGSQLAGVNGIALASSLTRAVSTVAVLVLVVRILRTGEFVGGSRHSAAEG